MRVDYKSLYCSGPYRCVLSYTDKVMHRQELSRRLNGRFPLQQPLRFLSPYLNYCPYLLHTSFVHKNDYQELSFCSILRQVFRILTHS